MFGLLLQQGVTGYIGTFANALAYVYLSWNFVDHQILIFWIAVLYMVAIIRIYFHLSWLKNKDKINEKAAGALLNKMTLGVFVSGSLWGAISLFWLTEKSNFHLAVTAFILAGMSAGAVATFGTSFRMASVFLTTSLIPLIVVLILQNSTEYFTLGSMALLYCGLMGILARNFNRITSKALKLGEENEDLVGRINDASHEIRTPVAAITGFSELLLEAPESTSEIQTYAKVIHRNSLYLRKLVDNILLYSLAEEVANSEDREWVVLSEEIQDALKMVEGKAKEKNLNLLVDYSADLPDKILTNSLKLQQILTNLLNNAIKFTDHGKITVAVQKAANEFLSIEVIDSGIGINEEAKTSIFRPFYRENRLEVKRQEGSGLGLALAKKLSKSLGGDLQLTQSEVNMGSTFELKIPIGTLEMPPRQARLTGRKIVVVDDSMDIQSLLKNLLEKEGAVVTSCSDGSLAVDFINKNPNCDLVLMDLNMPVMNGYRATEIIRKQGYVNPIIAFTAYPQSEKDKCFKLGFTGYINKSDKFENYIKLIEQQLNRHRV